MRTHVPFEALWAMPIEVPYSLLVRQDGLAWTCGQLALNASSEVMAPGDLVAQSEIVCDYVTEILKRGNLSVSSIRRLVLYYSVDGDQSCSAMLAVFRDRFGSSVILDPVPVPRFYYDGVELEVDVFCGEGICNSMRGENWQIEASGNMAWASMESSPANLPASMSSLRSAMSENGCSDFRKLSEHWFATEQSFNQPASIFDTETTYDAGAAIDVRQADKVRAVFSFVNSDAAVKERTIDDGRHIVLFRTIGKFSWIRARSREGQLNLVEQTGSLMTVIANLLADEGLSFADVVKSTSLYIGERSAEALHDNMKVRNACYSRPGPASTGLPVFGFADANSKIAIDLTMISSIID
jgi:enamine deaminase RidA (YjgF/YER057c/UK114 family)